MELDRDKLGHKTHDLRSAVDFIKMDALLPTLKFPELAATMERITLGTVKATCFFYVHVYVSNA